MTTLQPKQHGLFEGLTPDDLATVLNTVEANAAERSFIENFMRVMREVQESSSAFGKTWTGMGSGMTSLPLIKEINQGKI